MTIPPPIRQQPPPGEPIYVEENVWTLIAEEHDGEEVAENIGLQYAERYAAFAFKADALVWIQDQARRGYEVRSEDRDHNGLPVLANLATYRYVGPTDAPGSCWSIRVRKQLNDPAEERERMEREDIQARFGTPVTKFGPSGARR